MPTGNISGGWDHSFITQKLLATVLIVYCTLTSGTMQLNRSRKELLRKCSYALMHTVQRHRNTQRSSGLRWEIQRNFAASWSYLCQCRFLGGFHSVCQEKNAARISSLENVLVKSGSLSRRGHKILTHKAKRLISQHTHTQKECVCACVWDLYSHLSRCVCIALSFWNSFTLLLFFHPFTWTICFPSCMCVSVCVCTREYEPLWVFQFWLRPLRAHQYPFRPSFPVKSVPTSYSHTAPAS